MYVSIWAKVLSLLTNFTPPHPDIKQRLAPNHEGGLMSITFTLHFVF
jgi:hypothetical protein